MSQIKIHTTLIDYLLICLIFFLVINSMNFRSDQIEINHTAKKKKKNYRPYGIPKNTSNFNETTNWFNDDRNTMHSIRSASYA